MCSLLARAPRPRAGEGGGVRPCAATVARASFSHTPPSPPPLGGAHNHGGVSLLPPQRAHGRQRRRPLTHMIIISRSSSVCGGPRGLLYLTARRRGVVDTKPPAPVACAVDAEETQSSPTEAPPSRETLEREPRHPSEDRASVALASRARPRHRPRPRAGRPPLPSSGQRTGCHGQRDRPMGETPAAPMAGVVSRRRRPPRKSPCTTPRCTRRRSSSSRPTRRRPRSR